MYSREKDYFYTLNPLHVKELLNNYAACEKIKDITSITTNYNDLNKLYVIGGILDSLEPFCISISVNFKEE